jgi:hypothetical protein
MRDIDLRRASTDTRCCSDKEMMMAVSIASAAASLPKRAGSTKASAIAPLAKRPIEIVYLLLRK